MTNSKDKKKGIALSTKISILISLLSIPALILSIISNNRSSDIFKIQNTPRLSAQIFGNSFVGRIPNRIDEVVTIPMVVFNNSDTFAYNVTLDLIIDDGTGRKVSFNEYTKTINAPMLFYKDRLSPREQLLISSKAMSSPNDSKELYSTGKLKFKAKLVLSWSDVKGRSYKFINLEELKYVYVVDEVKTEGFWFDSKKTIDTLTDKREVEKYSGLNFDY